MPRTFPAGFPGVQKQIDALAARLRAARLRRNITAVQFAERVGVSRDTLNRLEQGDANIAFGTYMRVLRVLGLERDIDAVAKDDALGRKLQDLELPARQTRKPKKKPAPRPTEPPNAQG